MEHVEVEDDFLEKCNELALKKYKKLVLYAIDDGDCVKTWMGLYRKGFRLRLCNRNSWVILLYTDGFCLWRDNYDDSLRFEVEVLRIIMANEDI